MVEKEERSEVETECYHVTLELAVDASLFDDSAQVELWVESQLNKDPDVALATSAFAEVL